ncbi:MAG: long-chain fatty acid--CoA ligase, partial [Candidatus Puniceispirillaceae bacterium]
VIVPAVELRSRPEEQMMAALKKAVARANTQLAGFEKVRKFIVASEEFTIENNQMTPTLKVKRHIVIAAYHDQLGALYR